jgi:hypothetical protein
LGHVPIAAATRAGVADALTRPRSPAQATATSYLATAAAVHGQQPRQVGFTLACQTVLSSWMLLATGACRDVRQLWRLALERIAANEVANRPGRIEPRMLKRRRHRYPLMHDPRWKLRRALLNP